MSGWSQMVPLHKGNKSYQENCWMILIVCLIQAIVIKFLPQSGNIFGNYLPETELEETVQNKLSKLSTNCLNINCFPCPEESFETSQTSLQWCTGRGKTSFISNLMVNII